MREIKEELGVRPTNYTFLGFDVYPGRKAGRFIAILNDKEYKSIKLGKEGQKYDLFTIDESLLLDMPPSLKRFIEINKKTLKEIIENNKTPKKEGFNFENNK